jgi:methylated-DNA-[protein]-cysteine S-methyltransferase
MGMTNLYNTIDSPLGGLLLVGDGEALSGLYMDGHARGAAVASDSVRAAGAFSAAREQLDAYFAGDLTDFELPLAAAGSPFQQLVWTALREIPYGETRSYGEIAGRIGRPGAARAVGLANGRNPIAIVVPCHRVVGADGSLTGFAGGLERKRLLLEHEAVSVRRGTRAATG